MQPQLFPIALGLYERRARIRGLPISKMSDLPPNVLVHAMQCKHAGVTRARPYKGWKGAEIDKGRQNEVVLVFQCHSADL